MIQNDNGPRLGQNYGETDVFTFSRKESFFWQKCILSQKNTRNFLRDWYLFWKRVLFPVMAETWLEWRKGCFFGPLERLFISHVGNDFSTFRSGVMAVFVKKTWPTRQKVFPLPTARALSTSNRPSAFSAQALCHWTAKKRALTLILLGVFKRSRM